MALNHMYKEKHLKTLIAMTYNQTNMLSITVSILADKPWIHPLSPLYHRK